MIDALDNFMFLFLAFLVLFSFIIIIILFTTGANRFQIFQILLEKRSAALSHDKLEHLAINVRAGFWQPDRSMHLYRYCMMLDCIQHNYADNCSMTGQRYTI